LLKKGNFFLKSVQYIHKLKEASGPTMFIEPGMTTAMFLDDKVAGPDQSSSLIATTNSGSTGLFFNKNFILLLTHKQLIPHKHLSRTF
jgi:hypothetical protein